jgi:hypothetical protein
MRTFRRRLLDEDEEEVGTGAVLRARQQSGACAAWHDRRSPGGTVYDFYNDQGLRLDPRSAWDRA